MNADWSGLLAAVTPWLALYGAGLSTLALWRTWKKDRRSVSLSTKMLPPTNSGHPAAIAARAVNTGHRPVMLTSIKLHLGGGRVYSGTWGSKTSCQRRAPPFEMRDGDFVEITISQIDLAHELERLGIRGRVRIRAIATDSEQRVYRSSRLWTNSAKLADA